MEEVNVNDLLIVIGAKEVELVRARTQLASAQQQIRKLTEELTAARINPGYPEKLG